MQNALQPLSYGTPSENLETQTLAISRLPFEETLARLREAIKAEDLWLIQEINPQALMERGGHAILPTRQLLFFHPRYMVRLLGNDPSALMEVPLKLVVQEMPDGQVFVRRQAVAHCFQAYSKLQALGAELDAVGQRLVAAIAP